MTETEARAFDKLNSAENTEPIPVYPEDEHKLSGLLEE